MVEKSQSPRAGEKFEKNLNLKTKFRWDREERMNNLIQCMLSYKSEILQYGDNNIADGQRSSLSQSL